MKKNSIIVLLCIIVLTFVISIPVFATEPFSENSYNVSYGSKQVTVSGKSPYPSTRVTLIVLNPGKTLSDVEDSSLSLQYQRELMADEDGMFSVTFPINTQQIDTETDNTFCVYAKVPGYSISKISEVEYKAPETRYALLAELKKSSAEIEAVFESESNCIALGVHSISAFESIDKSKLAKTLEGNFGQFQADEEGYDSACEYLKEFCVLELFNQNLKDKVYDDNGKYLHEDSYSFSGYDKKNGTTAYECYLDEISKKAQGEVRDSLFGQDIKTPEALYREFAVNTVLIGITEPKVTGYAHVGKLLSSNNCDLIGLEISGEIDGDIEAELAGNKSGFKSLKELEEFIESLYEEDDYEKPTIGSGGGSGGGSYSSSIKVDSEFVKSEEPAPKNLFNDVPESHWAFNAVTYLKVNNIVTGSGNNDFMPDSLVTREQLVKMILAAARDEIINDAENKFADVDSSSWYAPYVLTALQKGYVNGISNTEFGVGQFATRQDICVIINRVINLEATNNSGFNDGDMIADYAKEAVSALSGKGIVTGYPNGSFGPREYCTRAEMATIIYRTMELFAATKK